MGELVWGKRRVTKRSDGRTTLVSTTSNERQVILVPAVVDRATFEAAQRRIAQGRERNPRRSAHVYLLSGLVRCGVCGGIVYAGNGGPGYRYYRCAGRYFGDPGRCGAGGVRAADLDGAIWGDIDAWLHDPGPVLERLDAAMRANESEVASVEAEHAEVIACLSEKQGERERVIGLYRRKRISQTDLDAELDKVAAEVEVLEARQASLELKLASEQERRDRLAGVGALLARLRVEAEGATPQKRAEIAQQLIRRVTLTVAAGRQRPKPSPRVRVEYHFDPPGGNCAVSPSQLAVANKMNNHAVPLTLTVDRERTQ